MFKYLSATLIFVISSVIPVQGQDVNHPAGIILDGSLGKAQMDLPIENGTYDIKAGYGRLEGTNLFHSFRQFNLHKGETAAFEGPDSVQNIIGRITGGKASWINGTLQSKSTPGADLYLLNPAGMIFGPNAKLDLTGSFHVSSADYLKLGDNGAFYADPKNGGDLLISAPPSAFGFLDGDIGKIVFNPPEFNAQEGDIEVKDQKELSVIGGGIEINNYVIKAYGGRLYLSAVASKGEVIKSRDGLDTTSFAEMGDISVLQGSLIDVTGYVAKKAGSVFIAGKKITLGEKSRIDSNSGNGGVIDIGVKDIIIDGEAVIDCDRSENNGKGIEILIIASEKVQIDNGHLYFGDFSENSDGTPGSKLTIKTKTLTVKGKNATIEGQTFGAGTGGYLKIEASVSVLFSEEARINTSATKKASETTRAGDIHIETPMLTIESGASLKSESTGKGDAGSITVKASDFVKLNNGEISTSSKSTGGGKINIGVGKLLYLLAKANIATDVEAGKEKGGNIWIGSHVNVDTAENSDAVAKTVVLNHGTISAGADAGDGGTINIHTNLYMKSVDSSVTAISRKGNYGTVKIEAPDLDISGEVIDLPENFLDIDQLKETPCSQRSGVDISYLKYTAGDAMPKALDDLRVGPPLWMDD